LHEQRGRVGTVEQHIAQRLDAVAEVLVVRRTRLDRLGREPIHIGACGLERCAVGDAAVDGELPASGDRRSLRRRDVERQPDVARQRLHEAIGHDADHGVLRAVE
jgi:hypothetical protein